MTQWASASHRTEAQRAHGGSKLPRFFLRPAALALALALLVALAGCDQSAVQPPPKHPTLTPTPTGLPAFADWRAAYLSSDGFVHVVTLDGKTDLTGPALPPFKSGGQILASAGASPDGHLLAYNSTDLVIANVAGSGHGASTREVLAGAVAGIAWSPDSRQLALNGGLGELSLLRTTADARTPVPGTPIPNVNVLHLWGWLDASHLAIGTGAIVDGKESATAYVLSSLDVTSGALRAIATIRSPGLGAPAIILSPDGSRALFYNGNLRDRPFTPIVDAIDTATGTVTPLPTILRATYSESFGREYTSLAWRPGTHQLAVSTGFLENNDLKMWLLDLDHDTATPLLNGQYVAQWSPDGATLVVSTSTQAEAGLGPFDLSAVTFAPDGQPHVTLLTHFAMSFPFLGFVRTA
jgi:WD40 repeat protein